MQPSDEDGIMSPGYTVMIDHVFKQIDRITNVFRAFVFSQTTTNPHSSSILRISHDGMAVLKTNHPFYNPNPNPKGLGLISILTLTLTLTLNPNPNPKGLGLISILTLTRKHHKQFFFNTFIFKNDSHSKDTGSKGSKCFIGIRKQSTFSSLGIVGITFLQKSLFFFLFFLVCMYIHQLSKKTFLHRS